MLEPAILHKDELLKKFAKEIYSDRYFWYMGYAYGHKLPDIGDYDDVFQWAIVDKGDVLGWFAYKVYQELNSVENFGLFAFQDKALPLNCCREINDKLEELVSQYHKVSWRVISGNPVCKHYDKFCKKHQGNKVCLHDVCKDNHGNYHDEYIYEILDSMVFC